MNIGLQPVSAAGIPRAPEETAALRRYSIHESAPDAALDALANLAARMFGIDVALADEDQMPAADRHDLPVSECSGDHLFVAWAAATDGVFTVLDASADSRFRDHPLVKGPPHIHFYASAPMVGADGASLGAFVISDEKPRKNFSDEDKARLADFAAEAAGIVETRFRPDRAVDDNRESPSLPQIFKAFVHEVPLAMAVLDKKMRYLAVSKLWHEIFRLGDADIIGKSHDAIIPAQNSIRSLAKQRVLVEGKAIRDREAPFQFDDGSSIWLKTNIHPWFDEIGEIGGMVVYREPITEQVHERKKVARDRAQYSTLYNLSPIMLHSLDKNGCLIRASGFWLETLGYEEGEVIGNSLAKFMEPDCARKWEREGFKKFLQDGRARNVPYRLRKKNGDTVEVLLNAVSVYDEEGEFDHSVTVMNDVTELNKSNRRTDNFRRRIEAFFDHGPGSTYILSVDGKYQYGNTFFRNFHGIGDDVSNLTPYDIYPPETADALLDMDRRVVESKESLVRNFSILDKDGATRHFQITRFPILDDSGEVEAIGGVGFDMSELVHAETALRQSQKMEAVGNLTGGIAHDFNNILAIIIGNLQLVQRRLDEDSKEAKRVREALNATVRGSELTKQLLAFSRRQDLEPSVVDVNRSLKEVHKLVRRTLAENIEFRFDLAANVSTAYIDPNQLQTAIINLCITAPGAMPAGGNIHVQTRPVSVKASGAPGFDDLKPGNYVCVSVTDDGHGMSAEVREHAFDPFFTTKDIGTGTGLGLAMVYGFIKQSGGNVTIYSEIGHGTTVRLYLPVADGAEDIATQNDEERMITGNGHILIVEDDEDVRSVVQAMIEDLGFETEVASSAAAALDILERERDFDLIFSDIVMPGGMTGVKLSEEIEKRGYQIPVLLTSGYPRDARSGGETVYFLSKPYQQEELAEEIQAAIAEHRRASAGPTSAGRH